MARNRFRGDAQTISQVQQFSITGAGVAGDTVVVTINGKDVTGVVPAAPTTSTVAAAVVAALQASEIPEFLEAAWSQNAAAVIATCVEDGAATDRPITFSVAVTGAVTVGAISETTASAGPRHWDTAENWSLGAVPVNTNDVDIQDIKTDILYGLDQNAVTLASLNTDSTFTGKLGLPENNPAGYREYRNRFLKIGATALTVGYGTGPGSGRMMIDLGSVQSTVLVLRTGSPAVDGQPALFLKGTHASNAFTFTGGSVGVAFNIGDVSTVLTLGVATGSGINPPVVQCGAGLTLGTSNVQGGTLYLQSGHTTCNQDDGEVIVGGPSTCNLTTLNGRGGAFRQDAPGTIGTASLPGGFLDLSRDPRAKTVTNCTAYHGSTVNDPYKHCTFTNPISCPDGVLGPGDQTGATLNLGQNISVQRS